MHVPKTPTVLTKHPPSGPESIAISPPPSTADPPSESGASLEDAASTLDAADASAVIASDDDVDEHAVNPAGIAIATQTKAAARAEEFIGPSG
jgi:hypothetical protein